MSRLSIEDDVQAILNGKDVVGWVDLIGVTTFELSAMLLRRGSVCEEVVARQSARKRRKVREHA
jgi:mannose/fructose-specific phosphotransferase system component IIA